MSDTEDFRPGDLVGTSVQRREDPHLLSGEAEYTDDIQHPDGVHLALVRSQYGHARVEDVDASEALATDGVVAVYTAADVEASDAPGTLRVDSADRSVPAHPLLAGETATYQGQPVAAVVAEDRYTARDAAGRVDVSYDRLPAVVDPEAALGIILAGSTLEVEYPVQSAYAMLKQYGLQPDDSISELLTAVRKEGSFTVPPSKNQ